MTFYAFSPADNSSVTFNTSNKQLTYTAPTAQGSQQDVLYAYASSSRPANNTIGLTFNHANAAFSVKASLASGCTATVNISGVKLVNVKPTNTLTVSSGSASASGSNISTDVAINSTTLTTTAQTISSSPLMLPPQSVTAWSGTSALANTYLAVTCKVQANDSYVVGSASSSGTVYVPMSKVLNKGEDNTVNLVFGTLTDGKRSYGRDDNGNRITVNENTGTPNMENGHEYVDLGLSVNWATMDVGASSSTDLGNYYCWGNISTNVDKYWDSNAKKFTKYTATDGLTKLEPDDDVAHVEWGGKWRMPTMTEIKELVDNCNISNGIWTSKKAGYTDKSINFIWDEDRTVYGAQYWGSTVDTSSDVDSYDSYTVAGLLTFGASETTFATPISRMSGTDGQLEPGGSTVHATYPNYGRVRPVCDK